MTHDRRDVPQDTILDKTVGELGSLLDEVARGTSRYRTVHSLTEQIEHQYVGRFAIELIQNAHDPIAAEPGWGNGEKRIELLLELSGAHGTLLVANDGRPFRDKDFRALSNLGQSSKNPNEAIGNKGIGFRSVLEVSKAPEIYSCRLGAPGLFDGYCFRFDPEVLSSFEKVIIAVLGGDDEPRWRHDGFDRLVGGVRGEEFRARVRTGLNPLDELRLLSAYSLPVPTAPTDSAVLELARRGFATVVRLPVSDGTAREKVEQTLGRSLRRRSCSSSTSAASQSVQTQVRAPIADTRRLRRAWSAAGRS
jgi:hypothetical protein